MTVWSPPELDPRSLVPLYYQLYEALKEGIDSSMWRPDGRMPSEPELMRIFDVSRIVIRQALGILEDDGQILRIRGKGTFVAPSKLPQRIGGLSRNLMTHRSDEVRILTLDNRTDLAPRSIRSALGVGPDEGVVRITTLLSVRSFPVAITYSFFGFAEGAELAAVAQPGRLLPPDFTLSDLGLDLAHNMADVEVSDACKFEADRLETLLGSTVFVVSCTEFCRKGDGVRPLERARVIYRGDSLRLMTLDAEAWDSSEPEESWELPLGEASGGDPLATQLNPSSATASLATGSSPSPPADT